MGYQYEIQNDLPYSVHTFDDWTGTKSHPLVYGGGSSALIIGETPTYPFPAFVNSRRDKTFSLEAWFRPFNANGTIIGHAEGDGIVYDGDIHFVLKFAGAAPEAVVSYTPEQEKVFHVVGSFNGTTISLFVDGMQVGETVLTPDQLASPFIAFLDEDTLITKLTSGKVLVDCFALYTSSLKLSSIYSHYQIGQRSQAIMSSLIQFGGEMVELNHDHLLYSDIITFSNDNWPGLLENVSLSSGSLRPDQSTGSWTGSILVDAEIDGAQINFKASGSVVISTRVNEATFEVVSNGDPIVGASGQVDFIEVKVDFLDIDSLVEYIEVSVYADGSIPLNSQPRILHLQQASLARTLFYPIEQLENVGLRGAGEWIVENDATAPEAPIQAIEFWFKTDDLSNRSIISNINNTLDLQSGKLVSNRTLYLNGQLYASDTIRAGEWYHLILTFTSTPINESFVLGNLQYGNVVLYRDAPTDANKIYQSYFGADTVELPGIDSIGLSTEDPEYDLYAYEWAILGAG